MSFDKETIIQILDILKWKGIQLAPGLSDREIFAVEEKFQLRFPPDLRALLQTALPISSGFYHWRNAIHNNEIAAKIQNMLHWPLEGVLYDTTYNDFWVENDCPGVESWGPKPETDGERIVIAIEKMKRYSKLIPIYAHRFIPQTPCESGNPVFSVYQTDVIYYGSDLKDYFQREFVQTERDLPREPKHIPFWSDLCDGRFEVEVENRKMIDTTDEILGGFADCYVFTQERSQMFVKRFLDHFVPNRGVCWDDDFTIPQYENDNFPENPRLILKTESETLDYLEKHLEEPYYLSWRNSGFSHENPEKSDLVCAECRFTREGFLILSLSCIRKYKFVKEDYETVVDYSIARDYLRQLKEFAGSEYGLIIPEAPEPPENQADFLRECEIFNHSTEFLT